jgi:lysozyme
VNCGQLSVSAAFLYFSEHFIADSMNKFIFTIVLTAVLFSCGDPPAPVAHPDSVKKDTATHDTTKAVSAGPNHLYGIDISVYQGDEMEFLKLHEDSLAFVICRATLGLTVTDKEFKSNWALIEQKGFVRGAYHFYECNDDPKKQAEHFLTVVGTLSPNDLPPVLDFEEAGLAGVTDKAKIQKDLLIFLQTVETATGRTPMIYVSPAFAPVYLKDTSFAKYPLYVADYNGKSEPDIPKMWASAGWTFWQKTDTVQIEHHVDDFDVFNGSAEVMKAFIEK